MFIQILGEKSSPLGSMVDLYVFATRMTCPNILYWLVCNFILYCDEFVAKTCEHYVNVLISNETLFMQME